jgi:hypothetical protein
MSSDPRGDEDVKELLGRALAGEPPLTLDRDEVFRAGRRRLRIRRLFSSGGVVTGVVAAAVGAVLITTPIAEEPPAPPVAPPAASGPENSAPIGPSLPLDPSVTTPPSSRPPMSEDHAVALTGALVDSGLLGKELTLTGPKFYPGDVSYDLQTDVITPAEEGTLTISVAAAPSGAATDCAELKDNAGCEVRTVRGTRVAVGTWKDYGTGEKRLLVYAIRADGTSVKASASNLSDRRRADGRPPVDKTPVVDEIALAKIATIPDLRFAGWCRIWRSASTW